jgi:Protein of unknown function (DUF2911)
MRILYFVLLLFPVSVISQKSVTDKGIVYYTLGTDTTIIQYFEYTDHHYKTSFVQFTGTITKCEAEGLLDEDGDLKEVTSTNYRIAADGKWEVVSKGVNLFNGDSTVYIATNPQGVVISRRSFPGNGIVANGMDIASFYTFPYMGFYAPPTIGDTLVHRQLSFNSFRKYIVTRKSKNEIRIGSNLMGNLLLIVDGKNRLQKIEGVGSSLNLKATVNRNNANSALLDEAARRRNAAGTQAVRTLRDTAAITLNKTTIEIDYWRPHKRGREIFGNVVPWNKIWRTGANNATQLRFNSTITINGNQLPAGKYGIWSYPTTSKWELIINKNANAWGTDHDPSADVLRVPLLIEQTKTPVEVMKISFIRQGNTKATLLIEWDLYRASLEIEVD